MNWIGFVNALLGLWLISSPETFGYKSHAMAMVEWCVGGLAIVCGLISVRHPLMLWSTAFLGVLLQFAPLVLWAPNAASYLNSTLIGVLLIIFSIVVHGTPGVKPSKGAEIPPGWSYNPSSYLQRIPVIGMNFACWFIARYLAAFQLGYIDHVWDPVFGDGTVHVLTSSVSKMFPVSDAGLGALAYTIEAVTGFGDSRRWHTMPWMVIFFGILVIPVSCTSIALIILQPTVVGSWCFLCIVTAILMLSMIPLTVDEVVAVIQFLHRSKKQGKPFWKTFWKGGEVEEGPLCHRTPQWKAPAAHLFRAMAYGVSLPWNLVLSIGLGAAAIFLSHYIEGALAVVFSVTALAEVTRKARFLNVLLGARLLFYCPIIGAALIALAWRKGPVKESYGSYPA